MWSNVKFMPAIVSYWMWVARPQLAVFELKTAKEHSKSNLEYNKKRIDICKNQRVIRSTALLERHGGSFERPEAARGLKSRFMTVFRNPFGLHFQDLGGLEAVQKHFGRGLRCALLEKSFFKWCLARNQYFWSFIGASKPLWNRPHALLGAVTVQTFILMLSNTE